MREFSTSTKDTLSMMSHFVCEENAEVGLYPRASCIIIESLKLYKSQMPSGVKVILYPAWSFAGTDKSTDYAVVIVSVVSYYDILCLPSFSIIYSWHHH
jgi:hypothetical protein